MDRTEFSAQIEATHFLFIRHCKGKGKVLPYSFPSVRPAANPSVQVVSPQVTLSHPPGGRLPLLSARPSLTFPAKERHSPSAGTKLYCLMTEAHAYMSSLSCMRTGREIRTRDCYATQETAPVEFRLFTPTTTGAPCHTDSTAKLASSGA